MREVFLGSVDSERGRAGFLLSANFGFLGLDSLGFGSLLVVS